jgi:hypothetical protein
MRVLRAMPGRAAYIYDEASSTIRPLTPENRTARRLSEAA